MGSALAVVGVDIGMSGARAVAYASLDRGLENEAREYSFRSPLPGRAEQGPDEALEAVLGSGLWLVSRYLGISEKHALQSWSVMVTAISLVVFSVVLTINPFL